MHNTTTISPIRSRTIIALGMIMADVLSVTCSILLAWALRLLLFGPFEFSASPIIEYKRVFIFFYLAFFALNLFFGLYEPIGKPDEEKLRRTVMSVSFLGLSSTFLFFALGIGWTKSRTFFVMLWVSLLFISSVSRFAIEALMKKLGFWGLPVAVLTQYYEQIPRAMDYLLKQSNKELIPVLGSALFGQSVELDQPDLAGFKKQIKDGGFTKLIVFDFSLEDIAQIRNDFHLYVPEIIAMGHKGERSEWYGLGVCEYGEFDGVMMDQALLRSRWQFVKRIFDIALSFLGLILLSPLFMVLAFLVRLSGPGPVIFVQPRRGKRGRTIGMYKFRSMVDGAAEKLQVLLDSDPALRLEWDRNQKLTVDPRVTPIGLFLRHTSLDELPQLVNVLKGDMSLVGPRPIVIGAAVEQYGKAIIYCDMVRPGLTGLWQVSARNETSLAEHVALDYQYIMTWSVWKDLLILLKTPLAVVRGRTS